MKPLLYVRNEPVDTLGLIEETLDAQGLPVVVLDAFKNEDGWPDLDEVSGVMVGGGEVHAGATDVHPHLARQHELLREAVAAGRPTFGICLGAQLLAGAFGSSVHRAPVKEIGFAPLSLTDEGRRDPLLSAFVPGDQVFHWHEDTFDLPEGSTLLATGDRIPAQAFRLREAAWGVQFHPEVTEDELDLWFDAAGRNLQPEWGRGAEELREEARRLLPAQQDRAREMLRRFAMEVRSAARPPVPGQPDGPGVDSR